MHRRPGPEMLADLLVKIEPVHGVVFIEPVPKSILSFSSDHVFGVQSQRVERHPHRQGRDPPSSKYQSSQIRHEEVVPGRSQRVQVQTSENNWVEIINVYQHTPLPASRNSLGKNGNTC